MGIMAHVLNLFTNTCISQFKHEEQIQASRLVCVFENYFLYFSSKTYVVGTQKNRLKETVLLSTQNTCLN